MKIARIALTLNCLPRILTLPRSEFLSISYQFNLSMAITGPMAKCLATDMVMEVTINAVQLMGGYGSMREYPLERKMRDAKLLQIVEGTNQIQRIVITGEIFSKRLFLKPEGRGL